MKSKRPLSLFVLTLIFTLSHCRPVESDKTAVIDYKILTVAQTIQGTWATCSSQPEQSNLNSDCGQLLIQGDEYRHNGSASESTGTFTIEYREDVQSDALFATYDPNHILATITFSSAIVNGRNTFLIRVADDQKGLYFHSLVSEISLWSVTKNLEG